MKHNSKHPPLSHINAATDPEVQSAEMTYSERGTRYCSEAISCEKKILEGSKVLDSHPPLRLQLSGLIRLILGI